jgi:hypothetical protein
MKIDAGISEGFLGSDVWSEIFEALETADDNSFFVCSLLC